MLHDRTQSNIKVVLCDVFSMIGESEKLVATALGSIFTLEGKNQAGSYVCTRTCSFFSNTWVGFYIYDFLRTNNLRYLGEKTDIIVFGPQPPSSSESPQTHSSRFQAFPKLLKTQFCLVR